MNSRFDVIVIGVGAMGSAACYHLARRRVKVLGLEQFDIPHEMGSSHGFTRMIRSAYYEHADYVPLIKRAFENWRAIESESGEQVLHVTGGLYLGPLDGELVGGSLAASRTHRLAHELLQRDQVNQRFPEFTFPEDWFGLFENEAGFLIPELAIKTHCDVAARHGAEIHPREPVLQWDSSPAGVTVTTAVDTYQAAEVVFCGGAWSDNLVTDLGVPLIVTRQVMGWVEPLHREPFLLGKMPVWAVDHSDGTIHYGFPIVNNDHGLKIAHHGRGTPADPNTIDREPREVDEQSFRPALRKHLPDADGPLKFMRICMYTNSPDGHFIIDRDPSHPHVTLACGFSGHGFKFASVIGEALADLATKGRSDLPIQFLGTSRFH